MQGKRRGLKYSPLFEQCVGKKSHLKLFTRRFFSISMTLIPVVLLTGCPGSGDRLKADETTNISE